MRRKSPLTPDMVRDMQAPLELGSKAATRELLSSLKGEIEKAARESREREKLRGSVEAQKKLAAEKKKRQEELAAQVSAEIARKKETARRKNAALQDSGPTPERLAKLRQPEGDGTPTGQMHTEVAEFYAKHLTYEELEGARYLMRVWHQAQSGHRRVTGSYDGTPGTAFGPRRGGVAAHALDAHNQVLNIEAIILHNLRPKSHQALKWFWGALHLAREGAPMTEHIAELGRLLAPFVKDEDRRWGVAFGRLMVIWDYAYGRWVADVRATTRSETSPEQVDMRRAQRRRRMGGER